MGGMRFRKLRIGWSVVCGLVCVLLIALWARSYWFFDQFIQRRSVTDYVAYTTFQGQFAFGIGDDPILQQCFTQRWTRRGFRTVEWDAGLLDPVAFFPASPHPHDAKFIHWPRYSSPLMGRGTYTEIIIPYWLPCLAAATLATWQWLKWPKRFSLRALLIATTLVAVVLGMVVWAIR
jgi:hypothetical protein